MFARPSCFCRLCVLLSAVVFTVGSLGVSRAEDTTHREGVIENVNWEAFLAQHDLTWTRLPMSWGEGPFIGNGMLGTIVYIDPQQRNALRFEIGRSDVYDRQKRAEYELRDCRVPIGFFHLKPVGTIKDGSARLDLWNAEITGEVVTDRGHIRWKAFAAEDQVMVVEVESSPGEEGCRFTWHAEQAISAQYLVNGSASDDRPFLAPLPAYYQHNPQPTIRRVVDANVCVQELSSGGDYATGWQIENPAPKRQILYVTVCNSVPQKGSAESAARDLKNAVASGVDHLRDKHRRWWHDFYKKSFVSIPDTRLESFYWIQLYKMASGTRENGAILDLLGPWFKPTGWPCFSWDLNVQLTYWPMMASNHLELGEPLYRLLDAKQAQLIENAPAEYRHDSAFLGGATGYDLRNNSIHVREGLMLLALPWGLHNYWLHYRHSMDDERLREKLFPLMKRAWNMYLHVLTKKEDGRYHLPLCYSAEYGCAKDTNQDLAIIRWGCQTLLDICQRLKIDDPLVPRWRDVLANLAAYPQNDKGLLIGKNVPLAMTHRHYSHLLGIYPFRVLNAEQGPGAVTLMRKSVDHWLSFPEGVGLCGFSYTGASSMMSCLGDGDAALKQLNKLLDLSADSPGSRVQPNTLYTECGALCWPTIETPLSAVQSLFDMLIQSWSGTIRVFPAVPNGWRDVTIHNLRTEGAFLVSAIRRDGVTRFVRITSLAGEPCRVRCDVGTNPQGLGTRSFRVERAANGDLAIDLQKGETVTLRRAADRTDMTISAVNADKTMCNYFGAKRKR